MFTKTQIKLLFIFYKSTLLLSLSASVMLTAFAMASPMMMLFVFGVSIMSAGTIIPILYKETSKQGEYYFFYNMGVSKTTLILTCAIINFIIGSLFLTLFFYARHA